MKNAIIWSGWGAALVAVVCLIVVSMNRSGAEQKSTTATPAAAAVPAAAPAAQESQAAASEAPRSWQNYARSSPFKAVRWRGSVPEVQVDGATWYELIAINDVPADQIVAYAQSRGKSSYQKHFEEDLVELMTRMGHQPDASANLKVKDLTSGNEQVVKDVPMTEENRDALRDARAQRELAAQ